MLKTYAVLGRTVQVDPDLEYLKPNNVSSRQLLRGSASFYPLNVEDFLAHVSSLPTELHDDFYSGIELHLMECRSILGFIEATEGEATEGKFYEAEKVVMDGPVESPNPKRTQELKAGLKNTIGLLKQLQKYRK